MPVRSVCSGIAGSWPKPVRGAGVPAVAAAAAATSRRVAVLAAAPAAACAAGPAGRTGGEEAMPAFTGCVMSWSVPRAPMEWLPA